LPKRRCNKGAAVRLKFETIFLLLVWIAVILLVILYPRFITR
jgi:hypothetical protein